MERPTGCADTFQWQDYADHLEQQIEDLKNENYMLLQSIPDRPTDKETK